MKRFLLIAAFILSWTQTRADTLYVPSVDYPTIQSAINAAGSNDTIIVDPNTYYENIDFLGKAITLRSVDPNDPNVVAATIIDGSNPVDPNIGSVVTFDDDEDANSVLTGFTIQNGSGQTDPTVDWRLWDGVNGDGGGVLCSSASPTITKNVFKNCRAEYGGGAIFCHNSASPIITQNTFLNNYAGWYGGAIFGRLKCSPTISNNLLRKNECKYLGGAIYLADQSYSEITNNWFQQNNCEILHGGAIYYFISSAPIIACNFFIGNTCSGFFNNKPTGAAIMTEVNTAADSDGKIINNLFTANDCTTWQGAVIRVGLSTAELIANNIIYDNGDVGIATRSGASPVIRNNNVWENTGGNYGGSIGDQTGINGNISADPQIAPMLPEPFTVLELQPDSPCIDAGNAADLPSWLCCDYDGSARIVNGTIDIGPQEYHAIAVPQDFCSVQEAINAAASGDEIIICPGFYQENIDFLDKNIRLRSLNPLDPNCVAQTVIDGNGVNSCIKILSGQNESTAVAGLRIQNGYGTFGGGIHVGSSVGPQLMYNYITNNTAVKLEAPSGGYGGGIDCRDDCYTKVMNNTIIDNFASNAGGGIHIGPGSNSLVINNRIIENHTTGEAGGGIYSFSNATITIIDNEIIANKADTANGGGIWLWDNNGALVEGNIIMGNSASPTWPGSGDGRGGGIGMLQGTALAQNNLICGNTAALGGGVSLQASGSYDQLINNTIVGNIATEKGAGIYVAYPAAALIVNNIIANNGPTGGIYAYAGLDPNIIANDLWNNQDQNYLGGVSDLTGTNGNISADPCFIDAGHWDANNTPQDPNDDYWVQGDYRIGYYSPCRDAASPNNAPQADFDQNPRPHFTGIDIGAYELQVYDLTVTGTVDFTDLSLLADSWLDQEPAMPADLDSNGLVNLRDFALLVSGWLK